MINWRPVLGMINYIMRNNIYRRSLKSFPLFSSIGM
nr:MAG TPA: hypothetical protein [Caudoviricetes sp.]